MGYGLGDIAGGLRRLGLPVNGKRQLIGYLLIFRITRRYKPDQLFIRCFRLDEILFLKRGVRDNGPGIKPDVASTLFDPFVTSKPQGMGLGLSISYGIIEAHGGKLTLNPDYREGAEFNFYLPMLEVS